MTPTRRIIGIIALITWPICVWQACSEITEITLKLVVAIAIFNAWFDMANELLADNRNTKPTLAQVEEDWG